MSLFPAYSHANDDVQTTTATSDQKTEEWLKNSSFQIDLIGFQAENDTVLVSDGEVKEDNSQVVSKKKKNKKRKKRSKETENESDIDDTASVISTKRNKEFLSVKTISRPSVPKYRSKYYLGPKTKRVKRKFKRYFALVLDAEVNKSNDEEEKLKKTDLGTVQKHSDPNFTGFKQEEDMSQTTAMYNKKLAEDPHDIETWLEYIRFQDTIYHFEKTYRKGSIAKGLRVTAERKLSILDKALSHNLDCEQLMRERLNIAVSVYPSDEIQDQLKKLVEKEEGNIILWQGYIEATQCSMSHCNTPAVLALYNRCLSTLHKLRRNATVRKSLLEESILKMLYQCGLFLKQSGLFEQLWTLLRLYLELNLSPLNKNKFNIASNFQENQLVELEEVVLNSQLPLHELWLRVEKLREACHWLPHVGDQPCEDPQRLVFTEDVAELIHPITMPENTFILTATILTLLKVPLLPCRHTTMQKLGLDYVPWALDSVESLLAAYLPLHPVDISNKYLLLNTTKLTVGPQYLKVFPGQEEYLQFVLETMKNCADCLIDNDREAVIVWWFQFQKLLFILEKFGHLKMTNAFKKKLKSGLKNFLKQEENRSNLLYYKEYALVDYEINGFESALNVLTTASSLSNKKAVNSVNGLVENATLFSLNRTIIELYLHPQNANENNTKSALTKLVEIVADKSLDSADAINEAALRYKHVTLQLLQQKHSKKLSPVQHFLPDYFTDWIVCHSWFIYLTKGAVESGAFIEETLQTMSETNPDDIWQKEILYEVYVAILFRHCTEHPGSGVFKILDDVIFRALEKFPNNIFVLTVLVKELSINLNLGKPWWKLKSLVLKTGRALPVLFLVLIAQQRMIQIEESWLDTITGKGRFAQIYFLIDINKGLF